MNLTHRLIRNFFGQVQDLYQLGWSRGETFINVPTFGVFIQDRCIPWNALTDDHLEVINQLDSCPVVTYSAFALPLVKDARYGKAIALVPETEFYPLPMIEPTDFIHQMFMNLPAMLRGEIGEKHEIALTNEEIDEIAAEAKRLIREKKTNE